MYLTLALAAGALATGLWAAWKWLQASRVQIDLGYSQPGDVAGGTFTRMGQVFPRFCFAGLWNRADTADGPFERFTILTSAAGPDMQPVHNRQPVILPRDRWPDWLDLQGDPTPLYATGPARTLEIDLASVTVGGYEKQGLTDSAETEVKKLIPE